MLDGISKIFIDWNNTAEGAFTCIEVRSKLGSYSQLCLLGSDVA